jgi:hypothetical protein
MVFLRGPAALLLARRTRATVPHSSTGAPLGLGGSFAAVRGLFDAADRTVRSHQISPNGCSEKPLYFHCITGYSASRLDIGLEDSKNNDNAATSKFTNDEAWRS